MTVYGKVGTDDRACNLAESHTVPKLAILSTISRSTSVCPPRQKYIRGWVLGRAREILSDISPIPLHFTVGEKVRIALDFRP